MKNRFYVLMLAIIISTLLSANLFAFGSKEKPAADKTEVERTVDVYILNGRVGSTARTASVEAAAYLFQEFTASGGAFSVSTSREFSMPIKKTEPAGSAGELQLMELSMEIIPKTAVSYTNEEKITVEFSLDDLYSGSRIRMQPGQKAVLDALGTSNKKTGIVRVISMDYSRSGMFKAVVQTADLVE